MQLFKRKLLAKSVNSSSDGSICGQFKKTIWRKEPRTAPIHIRLTWSTLSFILLKTTTRRYGECQFMLCRVDFYNSDSAFVQRLYRNTQICTTYLHRLSEMRVKRKEIKNVRAQKTKLAKCYTTISRSLNCTVKRRDAAHFSGPNEGVAPPGNAAWTVISSRKVRLSFPILQKRKAKSASATSESKMAVE